MSKPSKLERRLCVVPNCRFEEGKKFQGVHYFRLRKDDEVNKLWHAALPGVKLSAHSRVCENHFAPTDILYRKEHRDSNGKLLATGEFAIARLKKGAVPVKCLPQSSGINELSLPEVNQIINNLEKADESNEVCNEETHFTYDKLLNNKLHLPLGWTQYSTSVNTTRILYLERFTVRAVNGDDGDFLKVPCLSVTITEQMKIIMKVAGIKVDPSQFDLATVLDNQENLETFIFGIDKLKVCAGATQPFDTLNLTTSVSVLDNSGTPRHKKCQLLLSSKSKCSFCAQLYNTLYKKRKSIEVQVPKKRIKLDVPDYQKKDLKLLQKKQYAYQRKQKDSDIKIANLSEELMKNKAQIKEISSGRLKEILDRLKVSEDHRKTIEEILQTSKAKTKQGIRYSDDWIFQCLLLHLKSPSTYELLRDINRIPLPHPRTMRRYFAKIDTKCGFDEEFFKRLKDHFQEIPESARHGILLLDEISTRENVNIDPKNMTFCGLQDYGPDFEKPSVEQQNAANYGLVFMFQSLTCNFSKPLGLFASRGPTNGIMLAEFIIKAIVLMENNGGFIHGVVSDGGSTNRAFWKELGVSGKTSSLHTHFLHPVDETRKVFVFSDTPHLLKTVRNGLYNRKILQMNPEEPPIEWKHIELLFDAETKNFDKCCTGGMRLTKLTKSHIYLNAALKMRVSLAAQVFSNSVSNALITYSKAVPGLEDCSSTANFCKWFNDLFDCLNSRKDETALQTGNDQYKFIQTSLQKLDSWEQLVDNGQISSNRFLTHQTAQGLRVTLRSMLDIVPYLQERFGFQRVLSGMINQDPLERFFGSARRASGSNDRPDMPNFQKTFKMLSNVNRIKPPTTGNVTVTRENTQNTLFPSKASFGTLFSKPVTKQNKVLLLENNLRDSFNSEARIKPILMMVREENIDGPSPSQIILLNAMRELENLLIKIIGKKDCIECKSSLQTSDENEPCSVIFENTHHINSIFSKYHSSTNAYHLTVNELISQKKLYFPCTTHGANVLAKILHLQLNNLMREKCYNISRKIEQESLRTRKQSCLAKT